jgi:putative ABC transport system permease protein
VLHDFVCALRHFRRNALLTATVVTCLAIGIGATTAAFSVIDAVLLRPLPYPNAERLVVLRPASMKAVEDQGRVSERELREWQLTATSFEDIAGYRTMRVDLIDANNSERLDGLSVTPEFLSVFSVIPSAGQTFTSDPATAGLILGRGLWARRFGRDPAVVGRPVPLGICCPQQPRTSFVAAVAVIDRDLPFPPTVPSLRDRGHGLDEFIDYLAPIYLNRVDAAQLPSGRNLEAVGRLKKGISAAQAQAEMDAIANRMAERFPETNRGWAIRVVSMSEELFGTVRPSLLVLSGGAVFVLLIACANDAVLLTFNAIKRFHEIAVRAALGAGIYRLARQLVLESLLLSLTGGVAGLLLAVPVSTVFIRLAPSRLPRLTEVGIDARALGFALGVTVLCGACIGLIPALRLLKFNLEPALRADHSRNATSHKRAKAFEPLIVVQVALTLSLLIGSGLMIRSLQHVLSVESGINTTNVITTTLSLPSAKHAWNYNAAFADRVVQRVRDIPGIEAVGAIRGLPMNEARFVIPLYRWDLPKPDSASTPVLRIRVIGGGYFAAMGIPIRSGRDFVPQDGVGRVGITKVIIINKAAARLYWQERNPVGEKLIAGDLVMEVVGVVGDVRYTSLETDPVADVYYPMGVFPQDEVSLVIRTATDPHALTTAIQSAIHDVEKDVFSTPFQTMDEVIAVSVGKRRFLMTLLSFCSAIGLLLAVTGIAGIVAYSLSLRIREVGIRIAIGAGPRDVLLLISRQGLVPAFAGLGLGILLSAGLTGLLRQMLYGISPYDPFVFGSSIFAVGVVATLAAAVSGYRACRVDASSILK